MSVLGHFRKSALATARSAFPPIATKLRTSREVRFVPEAAVHQSPYFYGQTIKTKGHAGITPHGL
jgi:hypothetical protein